MENDLLIEKTNKIISELVYPKTRLQKAYNYYNGKRDEEQYKYLEENYGIGNPTSVEFIPLIKKHVDALVGEYLGTPIIPKVSCKDSKTISNIGREKLLKIAREVSLFLKKKLKNSLLDFIDGKNITDVYIEQQLKDLIDDLDKNFISEYEIAALNVIEYIMQSRDTDIMTKLKTILLDLLISGYTYFRVKPSLQKNNVCIEALNPLNTFTNNNPESPYIKNSTKAVVRKWLTKEQILCEYGEDLSQEDLDKLEESCKELFINTTYTVISHEPLMKGDQGLNAGTYITPGYPDVESRYYHDLIPVYEVEWIETDSDFVMQRYETIKIAESIYILKGKNEELVRSVDNPKACTLSVNGVCFLNKNNQPYSLVLACASLQDKYDLLHFYRDNLIANSGTSGDFVDVSMLPTFLGKNTTERLLKYRAYKKTGIAPIDTAQEGRLASGQAPINTIFSGYDDTVKSQAILAILLAIDSVEQTASSITGVFRERLNGIEQRDAVTNVKQSATNSFIITKQYYQQMDLVTVEMLMDSLNCGKIVYKKGLKGILILGDYRLKIFTALPEHFTLSDYDIRITTSTDVIKDLELIKMLIPEFIKSNLLDPTIIFEALTSKSLTELKTKVQIAMKKQKEENNMVVLLLKLNEELLQLLKQSQTELQKAQKKIESLNETKIKLEQDKINLDAEIEWFKARTDRTFKTDSIELDKLKVEIELKQLNDGNPYNDTIKMN